MMEAPEKRDKRGMELPGLVLPSRIEKVTSARAQETPPPDFDLAVFRRSDE